MNCLVQSLAHSGQSLMVAHNKDELSANKVRTTEAL